MYVNSCALISRFSFNSTPRVLHFFFFPLHFVYVNCRFFRVSEAMKGVWIKFKEMKNDQSGSAEVYTEQKNRHFFKDFTSFSKCTSCVFYFSIFFLCSTK